MAVPGQPPPAGLSDADRLSMMQRVGDNGEHLKVPVLSKFIPNSDGWTKHIDPPNWLNNMIMKFGQSGTGFGIGGALAMAFKGKVTRADTGLHAGEVTASIAPVSPPDAPPIEAATPGTNFHELGIAPSGGYASAHVDTGTAVSPMGGGGLGSSNYL